MGSRQGQTHEDAHTPTQPLMFRGKRAVFLEKEEELYREGKVSI